MKFSTILLGVSLYLFSSAEANISTNTPFNAVTWEGGAKEKVVWVDDGKAPPLEQIGLTTVDLMAGNATSQTLIANIGKVPATAKEIDYTVPKDVGPPGSNYFIRYTAGGNFVAFSGTFTIAKVNGKLPATDPAGTPKAPTDPNAPVNATTPKTTDPKATGPKATTPNSNPYGAGNYGSTPSTPKSSSPSPVSSPASNPASSPTSSPASGNAQLPQSISSTNNASNLFPSFSGVAAAAVAFVLSYLY